jgi:toxin CcdB
MAQWDVYPNPSERSRARLPYLVVIQSDLLSQLPTRLVAPLSRSEVAPGELPLRLVPRFRVGDEMLVLKPHEVGSVESRALREPVTSLRAESHRIVDALDTVVAGV